MSLMKRILFILLVMALRNNAQSQEAKNASAFIEKIQGVSLDNKVERVSVSMNPYEQLGAIAQRVTNIQTDLVEILTYASSYCAGSEYEDDGAERIAVILRNFENLKKELGVLDTDLQLVIIKLQKMGVLND